MHIGEPTTRYLVGWGVTQMLQQGYEVSSCDYDGRTGAMLAAAAGHTAVMRLLLAARADLNAADNSGRTALDEACSKGYDAVVKHLKRRGARCCFEIRKRNLKKTNLSNKTNRLTLIKIQFPSLRSFPCVSVIPVSCESVL